MTRSRLCFWRVLRGLFLVGIPVFIGQFVIEMWLVGVFGSASEVTAITPAIIMAILAAPLAYVVTGIVLGDVGALESIRRSVTLFRARPASAVVVSLFELAAQYLTLFAASAGLDLVARVFESIHFSPIASDITIALTTLVILAAVFALGSLMFTVAALAAAPQVVMFLALTHTTLGLDTVRSATHVPAFTEPRRFRWLSWPIVILVAIGLVCVVAGLGSLA